MTDGYRIRDLSSRFVIGALRIVVTYSRTLQRLGNLLGEYEKWYAIEKNTGFTSTAFVIREVVSRVLRRRLRPESRGHWRITVSYGEFSQRREKSRVTRIPAYARALRKGGERERGRRFRRSNSHRAIGMNLDDLST